MIRASAATVYHGGGRRWFTLKGACSAEAKQRIRERKATCDCDYCTHEEMPGCPDEEFPCTLHGDRYPVALRRLTRMYIAAYRAAPTPAKEAP